MALRGGRIQVTLFGLFVLLLVVSSARGGDPAGVPRGAAPTAACADDPYEPDNTPETARPIAVGATQSHVHCDPDWVEFNVVKGALYVVETSRLVGGAKTQLQVYDCSYCSGGTTSYGLRASDDSGGRSGSRVVIRPNDGNDGRSRPARVAILEAGTGAYAPGAGYDVTVRSLDEFLLVPTAAHKMGLGGALFETDLRLFNPGVQEISAELVFTPTDSDTEFSRLRRTVRVGPGRVLLLPDILATLFEVPSGAGWIEIRPSGGGLGADSRTYNVSASGGTFGEFVPVQRLSTSLGRSNTTQLVGLTKSEGFRTNVGFCEVTGGRAPVLVELYDRAGARLASRVYDLPPFGHHQINDVFAELDVPAQQDARVSLQTKSFSGRIHAYAAVLDNLTSDFTWISTAPRLYGTRYFPIDARLGRTDLRIEADGADDLYFQPIGSTEILRKRFSALRGETLVVNDVAALFGSPEGGFAFTYGGGPSRDEVIRRPDPGLRERRCSP